MEMVVLIMRKISVLIVDDLAFMRTAIKEILEANGMTAAGEAENGMKAVQLYRETKPDVVLMDITMPVMNGIKALDRIMKIDSGAKVIMCSALGQNRYIIKSIQFGARDFIVKPFKAERIVSAIKKVLNIDG